MRGDGGRRAEMLWVAAAVLLFAAAVVVALLAIASDEELTTARDDLIPPLLAGSAVAALLAWLGARRRDADAEAAAAEAERLRAELQEREAALQAARRRVGEEKGEAHEAEQERRRLEHELAERERVLQEATARAERGERERDEERARRERADAARELERRWNQELRTRLAQLHKEIGALGDPSNVPALVLRATMGLLGAQKGLLLSREDLDSDGNLDLAHAEGFEHDPTESAIAQHFAAQVLERDETVRSDDPEELELERRTPADEEIDNLLAIPIYLHDRFSGVVVLANKPGGFHDYDDEVLLALGDHAGAVLHNARLRGQLRGSYLSTVRVLADAIEAKDSLLRGHSNEVSRYVMAVAERLGVNPSDREELLFASLLHDVGKIGISERILLKPGELTPEERAVVEQHSRIGYRLVEQVPVLREVALAVLHHHERWDGDGYPARLRGEEIPLGARIIGVADAFSAMIEERPYRRGMTVEEACEELKRCAGTQFDPDVVRFFVEELQRRPPDGTDVDALALALADPELEARREDGVPLLGFGAFSVVDNLTLLYSHRYLHEVAAAEAKRADVQGRPFAVVLVELPTLHELNREQGYAAGDEALKRVADAARLVASRCGGVAARESGSRIALLVPGADVEIAEQLGDEIANELGDGADVRFRVAAWRRGDSAEDVLARVRANLESAKVSG